MCSKVTIVMAEGGSSDPTDTIRFSFRLHPSNRPRMWCLVTPQSQASHASLPVLYLFNTNLFQITIGLPQFSSVCSLVFDTQI